MAHDIPTALGRPLADELRAGRWSTVAICLAAAVTAVTSDALVVFLGIFGWGLFASTLVPALAIGLNWPGATRAGAVSSILTGLGLTVALELAAWGGLWSFPAGVSVAAVTLLSSMAVFLAVSALTASRRRADSPDADRTRGDGLAPDVRLVLEV